jgi:hypothetical protein
MAHPQHAALFGGPNPYSCVSLSDRFGAHATVPNEPLGPRALEITRVYWYDDPERDRGLDTSLRDRETAGYLVVHFDRGPATGREAMDFWREVPCTFALRAPDRADVPASGIQKFWGDVAVFMLRIEPADLARMDRGVAHELVWTGADERRRWNVRPGVVLSPP